ncbi:hormone receptor 4 isoform X3 [Atheta coriaria]
MTLTRTPCELDKMSLFQDLKLKRRKVDSRCSSDGESVADTSTSSPDLVSPPSPKMTDAGPNPPSPDSTPPGRNHHQHPAEAEVVSSRLQEPGVFDGGGAGGGASAGTTSVIRLLSGSRAQSPPLRPAPATSPPTLPPRPHSSPGRPANASPVIRHSPLIISPQIAHQTSPVHQLPQLQHSPPTHHARQTSPQHQPHHQLSPQAQQQLQHQQQQQQHQQHPSSSPRNVQGVIMCQQATVIQNQLWIQNSRINGVKPELIGGNFNNSVLLGHQEQKQTMLSPGGGGGGGSTGGARANSNPPIRQTPTVIMGEAGGVRTMIWSQPTSLAQSPMVEPQLHATTSTWSNSSNSNHSSATNPEESAAQMLLNLGQERSRSAVISRNVTTTMRSPTSHFSNVPLNMERLWAGDLTQLPANQQIQALNLSSPTALPPAPPMMYGNIKQEMKAPQGIIDPGVVLENHEEEEQPMICMICEDKATGLHYGIITCEGCKGFFKRTVQNRRVYTCVADGNCEITKAQRNRCQYCRFKKCIEQGMVLQAVREDRMPGGRNSGAVYNLYKVKYKKHKKTTNKQAQAKQMATEKSMLSPLVKAEPPQAAIPPHLVNGTILKTALTNPSEVVHLRQRLDSAVSSSRDRNFSIEYTLSMIQTLIDCDEFQDIATLQNLEELLDHKSDLSEKLCQIGDSIVYKLVQWTKRLPFYLELPVEVHTRLLTHKWHELLVLTTSAYQAIHGQPHKMSDISSEPPAFSQEVNTNLCTLQNCLTSMMGRQITMDQLRQDVGLMVEKITHVTLMFRRIKLTMEEYVCLKVITMLNQARPGGATGAAELENIQERYMTCLRAYTQHICPQQPSRFQELLVRLPEVQSAAALLLESKMFYVPFLLNSAIQR